MKIFLAGKMDLEHGAWRDHLLSWHGQRPVVWETPMTAADRERLRYYSDSVPPAWPTAPNTHVLDLHDYVGPYRLGRETVTAQKHGGEFHGGYWDSAHGHGCFGDAQCAYLVAQNHQAIARADLVFAYLNTDDAYGTLLDIGYALGLGKVVCLGRDPTRDHYEHWNDYILHSTTIVGAYWFGNESEETPPGREWFRNALQEAISVWSACQPAPTRLTPSATQAFSNIAKWTSDPRVRNEAQRMLKHLSDG